MKTDAGGKYRMDMCEGPLFGKIVVFTVPLMITNVLQLLFNAADLVIVGRFAGEKALASVGATSQLVWLILAVFFGLSSGVNVVIARGTGAKDRGAVVRGVHTAAAVALYGGIVMGVAGILVSPGVLRWMNTPEEILGKAALYMRIYCAGLPFVVFFNFGAAILRAVGDTKRPLYFMFAAGGVNVLLNLLFVAAFGMDVAGVAAATVISNALAAFLVLWTLNRSRDAIRLRWGKIRIHGTSLREIFHIGLPGGIQGACYSFSNVTIQSAINTFGRQAIAGDTAAASIEAIVAEATSVFFQTAISFTGQNLGAKKYDRVKRGFLYCAVCSCASAFLTGGLFLLFARRALGVYNSDPAVIAWGLLRLNLLLPTKFLCGIMDVISGTLRGLGHSIKPMIVILCGVCGLRVLWVCWVFPLHRTLTNLYLSYPVSWALVILINGTMLHVILSRIMRRGTSPVTSETSAAGQGS
ncbi:MAG: MATE family efflux transporter [Lentisphaeria bacterium]|nr:MATE family efflux transporter [Lentisphaeria bacterium]